MALGKKTGDEPQPSEDKSAEAAPVAAAPAPKKLSPEERLDKIEKYLRAMGIDV